MSVSGLGARHQRVARHLVLKMVARLMLNPAAVHYTQGGDRWDGINHRKGLHTPNFWPYYGDCSATATHILWRALFIAFKVRDIVNGTNWTAGFTGTQASHGRRVRIPRVGDLCLYGPFPNHEHVAVYIGGGKVFSHGSEGGPYILPMRYRPDLAEIRRYI